eukprot:TRINITY_DN6050_c0_g1_i1.p1 TRINITY_DN6050_c0_g1~~TRINITY_DN6050_c0_g1_i1.p1  ORF type:complete len:186 (+),score=26.83 TRINITY_DN6050_c0_g1_i1:53-610(+)
METESNDILKNSRAPLFGNFRRVIKRRYQKLLDDYTPYVYSRWILVFVLVVLYIFRVFSVGGFYIVTYALAIYELNLFLAFITPQVDPEAEEGGPSLPLSADDEFRPFVRRLPEFKFWHTTAKVCLIALVCTFFPFLDIPVFWPILLIYFIVLFFLMMRKQIRHMIKHKYIPFTTGKPSFKKSDK